MIRKKQIGLYLFALLVTLSSCYKQNIMFQIEEYENDNSIKMKMLEAERNYILRANDIISFEVETNKGEALIDPNFQLRSEFGIQNQNVNRQSPVSYQIRANGYSFLPLIGDIKLEGYTLREADSILQIEYQKFYKEPYVITSVLNKRVFVFNGQNSAVVPLDNDNTHLIEILAASGGVDNFSKAHNIRLVRGDLNNPYVEEIDLSTIDGMQKANLLVKNRDIIYIEPVRRVLTEATRDVAPVISLVTSFITLLVLLSR